MVQAKAAAAPAAKEKTKVVHEFVLSRREGDARVPLMSDHDLDVVKQAKVYAISEAFRTGQARPDLVITDRLCTYKLNAAGKALDGSEVKSADGSTCEETEI